MKYSELSKRDLVDIKRIMLKSQESKCAICSTDSVPLHLDHDHEADVVRSLVCRFCNMGLGHFRDDPEVIYKAYQYVVNHKRITSQEMPLLSARRRLNVAQNVKRIRKSRHIAKVSLM